MRKIVFLFAVIVFSSVAYGQVGLNDEKDAKDYIIEYRILAANVLGRFRSFVGADSILKQSVLRRYLDKEPSAILLRILRTKTQPNAIASIFIYTVSGSRSELNSRELITLLNNEKEIKFFSNFLITN